jgi:hypothetical protein
VFVIVLSIARMTLAVPVLSLPWCVLFRGKCNALRMGECDRHLPLPVILAESCRIVATSTFVGASKLTNLHNRLFMQWGNRAASGA